MGKRVIPMSSAPKLLGHHRGYCGYQYFVEALERIVQSMERTRLLVDNCSAPSSLWPLAQHEIGMLLLLSRFRLHGREAIHLVMLIRQLTSK